MKQFETLDESLTFLLIILISRTLSPLGLCETYRGQSCAEFIGNQSIWVHYRGHQQIIERDLGMALSMIKAANQMSPG